LSLALECQHGIFWCAGTRRMLVARPFAWRAQKGRTSASPK
jgi:hypothetical protein